MTTDTTPKPCRCPQAQHKHGTALAYRADGCRCAPCVAACRRNHKISRYKTETGTHSYVPAGPARTHVEQLLQSLTVSQVEQRSGINRGSLYVLLGRHRNKPASTRIMRATETALLAVRPDRIGTGEHGLVDGTGSRRRFRALVALGWPIEHLRRRLGCSTRTTWMLTCPQFALTDQVLATTRDAIRRLYDELSFVIPAPTGGTTRARNLARTRNWSPPLDWDDDAIDDPAAKPAPRMTGARIDEVAVQRAISGQRTQLNRAEAREASRLLDAQGLSSAAISDRLGISARSVVRHRAASA